MRRRLNWMALAAVAAALTLWAGAGTASATVLEVGGFAKDEKVEITASLKTGASLTLAHTDGTFANTCTESHLSGSTESPYIDATLTGPISSLTFSGCTYPVTVHKAGTLHVAHIPGSTNGTVSSSLAEVTVGSSIGTLNCKTGAGVDIGTLTGTSSLTATMHINAVLNCGFLMPSATWKGTYTVTSPSELGVRDMPAPPPSATTTLEVGGEAKDESVEITASLKPGSSLVLSRTDGSLANTCTASHLNASTESPYHGAGVTGPINSLSFTSCERPVTVHKAGKLYVERTAGTNGTVFSEEAEVTVGSAFGTLRCRTFEGTHIGTLTGKKEGNAMLDINAVLNCGLLVPSASWKGTYEITSPSGLGVTDGPPPPPTSLEIGGVKQGGEVKVNASLATGTSTTLARTDGTLANTCTGSEVKGDTEQNFTTGPTGAISTLSFSSCIRPVTVHKAGKLYVEHIEGTTDGTVFSEEAEVTVGSPSGTLNCKTNAGTDVGTLTGAKEGHATMHIDTVLNCGFLLPSATWKGTYTVTSPTGLGVTE